MKADWFRPGMCGRVLRLGVVVAVLAAVIGVGAGGAPAASSGITVSETVSPAAGTAVAYSLTVDSEYTYVSYSITVRRPASDTGTLTHQRLSDPVLCTGANGSCTQIADTTFAGAQVVYTSNCPNAVTRGNGSGITCNFANSFLPPGSTQTVQIVFRVPQKGAGATAFDNIAAFLTDESTSDAQPQATHADTFLSNSGVADHTPFTDSATDALNSYTNPGVATTFGTDPTLTSANPQSTLVDVPAITGGGPVSLSENGVSSTDCPAAVTATNRACFGQRANVSINNGTPFSGCADTSCLKITGNFYGPSIPKFVTLSKVAVYHTYVKGDGTTETKIVPLCTKGTDGSGDCLLQLIVSKSGITWVAQGPSNGGWGNAG